MEQMTKEMLFMVVTVFQQRKEKSDFSSQTVCTSFQSTIKDISNNNNYYMYVCIYIDIYIFCMYVYFNYQLF